MKDDNGADLAADWFGYRLNQFAMFSEQVI